MKKNATKTLLGLIVSSLLGCTPAMAAKHRTIEYRHTASGAAYGIILGKPDRPLALIFTTNIKDSLTDQFTTIGKRLEDAGYSVAAIDVTCHGKDVRPGESVGLRCWAARVKAGGPDVFALMAHRASDVISDVASHKFASTSSVIAIGVSRGGYAVLKLAAADSRVNYLVLMAPVTDLNRLSEFSGVSVDQAKYGFESHLERFASDHIFLQIGNADDRVGTKNALVFMQGVVAAGRDRLVDFTAVISPLRGHGTAYHAMAANWAIRETSGKMVATTKAP